MGPGRLPGEPRAHCVLRFCPHGILATVPASQMSVQRALRVGPPSKKGFGAGAGAFAIAVLWWSGLVAWADQTALAEDTAPPVAHAHSLQSFQAFAPASAQRLTRPLHRVVRTSDSRTQVQQQIRQLRVERDSANTQLTALNSELDVVGEYQQQLEQQLAEGEQRRAAKVGALRGDLEAKLDDELVQAEQEITRELQRDLDRKMEVFEARQREAIAQSLGRELDLEERELAQLAQEIKTQTQELASRLTRLDADPAVADPLGQSMKEALERRKAQLATRRQALIAEREEAVEGERRALREQLTEQQRMEQQRRMTLKEAALRQGMAQVLHQARTQDAGRIDYLRQALDEAGKRHRQMADREAEVEGRLEVLEDQLVSAIDQRRNLEVEWDNALAQLELALERLDLVAHPDALAWVNGTMQSLTPELATELKPLPQRALAKAQRERQLEEQRAALRERQLALQLVREMEQQQQELRRKQERERQAHARQAEELLAEGERLAAHGAFDEALEVIADARALDPPQIGRVLSAREKILVARDAARREVRTAELERMFNQAMKVFEQGDYEEAIALFEQVIVAEAELEASPTRMAAGTTP